MTDADSDEDLMYRYREGNVRAFEVLYRRHKGPLYRYLLRQCSGAAVAEELFQDVWMKLIQARERYEVRAKFTTYLYRLAHHRLIDHYRRQSSRPPLAYSDNPDEELINQVADNPAHEPDNTLALRRQVQQLLQQLQQLPEAQREVFLLRAESGLSLAQIADLTESTTETVKSRLRYALAKLQHELTRS